MTEPIKLPPLGRPSGIWAHTYGETQVLAYARLAVEQNTADLRAENFAAFAKYQSVTAALEARAEKAEAECLEQARLNGMGSEREARLMAQVREGQAKLARLTTVAHKHEWFRTGAMEPGQMRCISCGVWGKEETPLPPVKEADK
jgi:hypothetical protein